MRIWEIQLEIESFKFKVSSFSFQILGKEAILLLCCGLWVMFNGVLGDDFRQRLRIVIATLRFFFPLQIISQYINRLFPISMPLFSISVRKLTSFLLDCLASQLGNWLHFF